VRKAGPDSQRKIAFEGYRGMVSYMKTIPTRSGFLAARSNGKKALSRGLVIQAVDNSSSVWRVGLTATKKIGNAVMRNRARRRMRALASIYLAPLAQPGVDYVLIARHDTVTADWQDMAKGLQKAIRYLHGSSIRSKTKQTVEVTD